MLDKKNLNMNELRGMPKDLDLLLGTTDSLIKKHKEGGDISSRIDLLERLHKNVSSQYQELLNTSLK